MSPSAASPEVRAATRRVALLSVATASILIVVKAIAWVASGSVAILASLSDSALDLVASLITVYAVRYAAEPPDAEHRFGHGKAEAFSSLMQGGLVFASGALIGREAINVLLHPRPVEHGLAGVVVMLISIGLTLALITAQTRVVKASGSIAISGDRAHYAADLASNAVALIGVGAAAWLGLPWLDAAAGLLVALWLIWGAVGVFREASAQLMDQELPEVERTRIVQLATVDPRVLGVHQLRTRASGPYVHMQMHADLAADISLAEAHTIMVAAENRLLEAFPSADIIIHPDPRGLAEKHGGVFAESVEG
ncbi:cation diffusion facilitator family transporter [Caulobacter segnis]|uniref:Cation transporter n=1 Tax=Caulobacter segnis TaxID=88688 RepID=A0A2W5VJU4_9CAUL|nr:cation diffusion facilitator family transporter [Caulobacter segnis]PZR35585.1 MAG: cation transporter [Caulobacter segnis]